MKKMLLSLLFSALISIDTKAQLSSINLDSVILKNRKANGAVLVNTDETGLKLYVVYKNTKVNNIYALNNAGKKIIPTYQVPETSVIAKNKSDIETSPLKCKVCFESEGKTLRCYEIDCSQLPPPKSPPKQHT